MSRLKTSVKTEPVGKMGYVSKPDLPDFSIEPSSEGAKVEVSAQGEQFCLTIPLPKSLFQTDLVQNPRSTYKVWVSREDARTLLEQLGAELAGSLPTVAQMPTLSEPVLETGQPEQLGQLEGWRRIQQLQQQVAQRILSLFSRSSSTRTQRLVEALAATRPESCREAAPHIHESPQYLQVQDGLDLEIRDRSMRVVASRTTPVVTAEALATAEMTSIPEPAPVLSSVLEPEPEISPELLSAELWDALAEEVAEALAETVAATYVPAMLDALKAPESASLPVSEAEHGVMPEPAKSEPVAQAKEALDGDAYSAFDLSEASSAMIRANTTTKNLLNHYVDHYFKYLYTEEL